MTSSSPCRNRNHSDSSEDHDKSAVHEREGDERPRQRHSRQQRESCSRTRPCSPLRTSCREPAEAIWALCRRRVGLAGTCKRRGAMSAAAAVKRAKCVMSECLCFRLCLIEFSFYRCCCCVVFLLCYYYCCCYHHIHIHTYIHHHHVHNHHRRCHLHYYTVKLLHIFVAVLLLLSIIILFFFRLLPSLYSVSPGLPLIFYLCY